MKQLVGIGLCMFALVFCGCAHKATPVVSYTALDAYPTSDMTGYDCAAGYEGEYQFVDMTVAEVAAEMDAGTSFALFTGYNQCPWCNAILNVLNDIAIERGIHIAYIDTRRNPAWESNTQITDYDLFVERFGSVLDTDDSGQPHLYVPHIFFIQDGQLVADHAGTVSSQENASDSLTEEQKQEYRSIICGGLDDIGI